MGQSECELPGKRVFVTGTDTDVGKTLVAGILARCWRAHYWKPIQAGFDPSTDSSCLASWIDPTRVLPERFLLREAASPNQAANREATRIRRDDFSLPTLCGPLVVEGAGGLMVPINEQDLMIDLIRHLNLPILLVARSGLGTLNHTLLSIEALRARQMEPIGVILNGEEHLENQRDIERFGQTSVLGRVPPLKTVDPTLFEDIYNGWTLSTEGRP